jgi:ribosome assembly protein 1
MIDKILTSLNIKILPRDLKSTEAKIPLQSLFNSWIPLSKALLDVVVEYLPSPLD